MRTSKLILGVGAGIAAGALIGVLMAPDKGENTRKKIASKGQGVMDEVKSKFGTVVDSFNEQKDQLFREAKSKFSDAANKVSDTANRVSDKVADGVHKAGDKVSDTARKYNV